MTYFKINFSCNICKGIAKGFLESFTKLLSFHNDSNYNIISHYVVILK